MLVIIEVLSDSTELMIGQKIQSLTAACLSERICPYFPEYPENRMIFKNRAPPVDME